MNFFILTLLILITALMLATVVLIIRKTGIKKLQDDTLIKMTAQFQKDVSDFRSDIQTKMLDLARQMNDHSVENTKFLQHSQNEYQNALNTVHVRLGEVQEATKSMMDVGKDISSLHDILRAPKLRGGIGELILADLLQQILPEDHFVLQYSFQDNTKVDAVIRLGQALIPIDAKFPLENFKRLIESKSEEDQKTYRKTFVQDVKKHIDAIASKYILPQEGTYDFAMMYIPAENVYYEAVIREDGQKETLSAYALKKKVIPVSPNSFYAYLQAIVRGLKGLRIEQSAQRILEHLGQLESDFARVSTDFDKVGSHLGNAQSSYSRAQKSFDRLKSKVQTLDQQTEAKLISGASDS